MTYDLHPLESFPGVILLTFLGSVESRWRHSGALWRLTGGWGLGVEAEFACLASGDLPLETGMETTGVREQSGFGWEVSKALFCLVAVGTVASLVCTKHHLCLI